MLHDSSVVQSSECSSCTFPQMHNSYVESETFHNNLDAFENKLNVFQIKAIFFRVKPETL